MFTDAKCPEVSRITQSVMKWPKTILFRKDQIVSLSRFIPKYSELF